jgi:signal peptidase I
MKFIPWIVALLLLVMDRVKERAPGARSPYKAAAATLFLPGLGQLYNGELRKAFIFWGGGLVLILLAALAGLLHDFWGMVFVLIASIALVIGALLDALRTAKGLQTYTLKTFNRWYIYIVAVILTALASIPVGAEVATRAFRIPSEGMRPCFEVGDYFIARLETPESYEDNRGDILVFRYPGDNKTFYIKRVVAFPGEEVEVRGGSLLINGQSIPDPWARTMEEFADARVQDFGPFTVPEETLFMLGDNLANSADSRSWGPLPRENIVGIAEFIYFSWDSIKKNVRFNRIGLDVGVD